MDIWFLFYSVASTYDIEREGLIIFETNTNEFLENK